MFQLSPKWQVLPEGLHWELQGGLLRAEEEEKEVLSVGGEIRTEG